MTAPPGAEHRARGTDAEPCMTREKSEFLRTLRERSYVHQVTDADALDALACESPLTAYIGFDCTAPSLHVGSLVPIMRSPS